MLKIIGDTEEFLNFDEYYVLQEYSGKDSIGFTLPLDHPSYKGIYEETSIVDTESKQRYLVKAIDEGAQTVNIKASLDLDELSADMLIGYTNNSDTVLNTITGVLPDGWTVQDHAYFNHRRTVELEAATPLEVIDACYDTYSIVCRFDNHSRIVHIYDPESGKPQGAYLTDELNLTAVNMKGKSDNFATRLYARGKDGLTFADINDGKDYVDDHTYSDKVISVYWKDDRYTIAENLLEDAKKNLAEMAVPQQSYSCSILDLARAKEYQDGADKNIYSFLDFELYMPVVLIDRRRKRRVTHRVTQIKRYPHYPDKNEITLSTVAPSIQNTVKNVQQQIEKPTSTFNQIKQAQIEAQTDLITGNLGGTYIVTLDPETGKPNGWAILDTDSIETAKNVWRMTEGGFGFSSNGFNGPFELAITMDGKINASFILVGELLANLIKTGRIQSQTGTVYFDLDANNGKGELAASLLKGVEDGSTTSARIGLGHYSGGEEYEGFNIRTSSGEGGGLTIAIRRETGDYTLANPVDLLSLGNLTIRSQAISTNPGGSNAIRMSGNNDTGEGEVSILRGTSEGSESVFRADSSYTYLHFGSSFITIFNDNKISFQTGGKSRASIENDGAYFGNLFSNGIQVTSDRAKKSSITKLDKPALDQVRETPVYQYQLTEDDTATRHTGIMYDEAPEELRHIDAKGNKSIDLYGMVSLLWKAVQELSKGGQDN